MRTDENISAFKTYSLRTRHRRSQIYLAVFSVRCGSVNFASRSHVSPPDLRRPYPIDPPLISSPNCRMHAHRRVESSLARQFRPAVRGIPELNHRGCEAAQTRHTGGCLQVRIALRLMVFQQFRSFWKTRKFPIAHRLAVVQGLSEKSPESEHLCPLSS